MTIDLSDPALPRIVVLGQTLEGETFRPSDWIERLIDTLSSYGADRRTQTRPYPGRERRHRQLGFLQAQMINARKCLVVDTRLRDANPLAYRFVLEFIRDNRLQVLNDSDIDPASSVRL